MSYFHVVLEIALGKIKILPNDYFHTVHMNQKRANSRSQNNTSLFESLET